MARDTGLADRIRAKGVRVVEVAGWRGRGSSTFHPTGAVHHHTAGSSRGTAPSLNTCIYGRPGLPGPLCQVMQSREANPGQDIAYVIADGRANHAGVGVWLGVSGNSNYHGLEVEHTGTGPVDARRHEISCRILAAMMEAPGSGRDPRRVCEHYEFATPPGRKIDFYNLDPPFPNRGIGVRARVKQLIGWTPGPTPPPTPPPTLRGNLMSLTFYFGVRGDSKRPTRLWDGGVVVDRPAQLVPRLDQLFDKQYQKNTGRTVGSTKPEDIIPREYTSPDLYDWLVEVGQSHRDDAPGWFARSNLDGAEYFILASGAGRYGKGRVFDLHKFTMAVAKFDTTPLPLDQDMLDEIPLIAGASS